MQITAKKNFEKSYSIIKNILGFSPQGKYTVYITHPGIKNGQYLGKNQIQWGNKESFENHTTVYLWHEIMHSFFGYSDIEHVIIQFIYDEELRTQLNGGDYPPFIGHPELNNLMEQIYPYRKKYLITNKKNIYYFKDKMEKIFS